MKRILAVIVFFAAAASLALGQIADKARKKRRAKERTWSRFYCRWNAAEMRPQSKGHGNPKQTPGR